jgi:hypothetical protein
MNTQYTPGPWKKSNVFIENSPNRYIITETKWGGKNIADCGPSAEGDWDVNEANSRLIAAAPDLLAACKRAEWLLQGESADPDSFETWKLLKAAINKAEGRE